MFHAPASETKQKSDSNRTELQPAHALMRAQQPLAQLHSTYGNQAVLRMLSQSAPVVQAKLAVNQPGDVFEREADRAADQVMRMTAPASAIQRQCSSCKAEEEKVQRKCAECEEEEKKTALQRKEAGAGPQFAPPSVHAVLGSPGRPLDPATRAFMEPRFGQDFSSVRVHTDASAAESAQAVNALAYTVGNHIVFGSGQLAPGSDSGRKLLAHELVHVQQQSDRTLRRQADTGNGPAAQPPLGSADTQPQPGGADAQPQPANPADAQPQAEATSASPGAVKALSNAQAMMAQTTPALWFDSWGNDLRDNNMNGKIDDPTEQGLSDGIHYGKTFSAMICKSPSDTVDTCPATDQSKTDVNYKVCIDIPIEAYKSAGVSISTSRWIPTFFAEMQKKPDWTVWKKPAAPSSLLDGDIVAADNPQHGHAGIVEKGMVYDSVLNLPGPTSSRKYGLYNPSGTNDMKSVARLLFEAVLSIDWVARPKK